MALQITDQQGDRVYIAGYIDLNQIDDQTVEITGLDVELNETYQVEASTEEIAQHPGFGAGRILRFICEKIKEALCSNCTTTNPE